MTIIRNVANPITNLQLAIVYTTNFWQNFGCTHGPTSGVATLNPATPLGFSNAKRLSRRVCRRGWFSSMLASEIQDRFTDA